MAKKKKTPSPMELIDDIKESIRTLEMYAALSVLAGTFKVGQKVRMSKRAIDHGLADRKKGTTGVVAKIKDPTSPWGLEVLIDGQKKPRGYLAAFWESRLA